MALTGRNVLVQISVDDSTYYIVSQIKECNAPFEADNIDTSIFGDDFVKRTQGLKDVTWSISGFYDPTDTNGQIAIRQAWKNDTTLYAKISYDGGTTSFNQEVKVSSYNISATVDGVVEIAIDLEGDGEITFA